MQGLSEKGIEFFNLERLSELAPTGRVRASEGRERLLVRQGGTWGKEREKKEGISSRDAGKAVEVGEKLWRGRQIGVVHRERKPDIENQLEGEILSQ